MTAALVIAMLAADPRVDTPTPKPIVAVARPLTHGRPFWTRTVKGEAAAMAGLGAADMTRTCRNLRRPGWHEDVLTQSCAANITLTVAFDAGAIGAAWALHRAGHDKLAKLPMAYMSAASVRGMTW